MLSGNVRSGKVTGSLSKDTRSGPTGGLSRPPRGQQFRQRTSRSGYGTRSSPKSKAGSSPRRTSTSTWRGRRPSSELVRQSPPRKRVDWERNEADERHPPRGDGPQKTTYFKVESGRGKHKHPG